jgi:hypothetical protein
MCHRILLLCLVLLPVVARAETYTVWEDAGIIYGRAESTGVVTRLSQWDGGAHDPFVDHHMAVWVDSRGFGADIYGYRFDRYSPREHPIRLTEADTSDPIISWGGGHIHDYWVAWREQGGVWANYANDLTLNNHAAFEVVGDYTGPFSLEGNVLRYDGGQVAMDPPPPPIPEPSTLGLLAMCLAWIMFWRRSH